MAKKTQIQKFRDMARTLEADESEASFDSVLRKVAQHKPGKGPAKATRPRKKR